MAKALTEFFDRKGITVSWRLIGVCVYRVAVIALIALLATFRSSLDAHISESVQPIIATQISNAVPAIMRPVVASEVSNQFREFHAVISKEFVDKQAYQEWVKETSEMKRLLIEVDKKLGILDQKVSDRLTP